MRGPFIECDTDFGESWPLLVLADRVIATFGRIDVWVNDASVTMAGSLTEGPLEDFRRVLDVNVMGYVHGAPAVLRVFRS